jgi:hypothetical protein
MPLTGGYGQGAEISVMEPLRALRAGAMVLVISGMLRAAAWLLSAATTWASDQSLAILSGQMEVAALDLLRSRGWDIRKPEASPLLVPVVSRASRETH